MGATERPRDARAFAPRPTAGIRRTRRCTGLRRRLAVAVKYAKISPHRQPMDTPA
jgi:hypothetical protein